VSRLDSDDDEEDDDENPFGFMVAARPRAPAPPRWPLRKKVRRRSPRIVGPDTGTISFSDVFVSPAHGMACSCILSSQFHESR